MTNLTNMLVFQGAWFACVLGAARGNWWIGSLAVVPLVVHFLWATRDRTRVAVTFLAGMAIAGFAIEFVMTSAGVYSFTATTRAGGLYWMVALWTAFATTLPLSLRWLATRPVLALASGACFGPLSFLAGAKLGAVTLRDPEISSLIWMAVAWGLVLPVSGQIVLGFFSRTSVEAGVKNLDNARIDPT